MKNVYLFGIVFLIAAGCTDLAQDDTLFLTDQKEDIERAEFDIFFVEKEMKFYEQKNLQRLANTSHLKKKKVCDSNIKVPLDYPTIQEAVDNVCQGGNVMVSSGNYFEIIYIDKPGIKIKALGKVDLIGGFVLNDQADETTIQHFRINIKNTYGIFTYKADKLNIVQNEIYDQSAVFGRNGVILGISNESTIHNNKINYTGFGITIITDDNNFEMTSHRNNITNNSINGFLRAGIVLTGNVDYNSIKNNTITGSNRYFRVPPYGGIVISGAKNSISYASCDNNEIKNNIVSKVSTGFIMSSYNSGNEISGNYFLDNYEYGIYANNPLKGEKPNIFKNNRVQRNKICDIVDETGMNVYINNTADCTTRI